MIPAIILVLLALANIALANLYTVLVIFAQDSIAFQLFPGGVYYTPVALFNGIGGMWFLKNLLIDDEILEDFKEMLEDFIDLVKEKYPLWIVQLRRNI